MDREYLRLLTISRQIMTPAGRFVYLTGNRFVMTYRDRLMAALVNTPFLYCDRSGQRLR